MCDITSFSPIKLDYVISYQPVTLPSDGHQMEQSSESREAVPSRLVCLNTETARSAVFFFFNGCLLCVFLVSSPTAHSLDGMFVACLGGPLLVEVESVRPQSSTAVCVDAISTHSLSASCRVSKAVA